MTDKKSPPRFGNYALLQKLRSEGDYIQCFRAVQAGLERDVEIRILAIKGGPESPLAVRFVEELKVLSRLDHPSILPVLDQGVVDGKRYFTTTLHNSKRLSDYLQDRGGTLPSDDFLAFAETLTDAIALIHDEGKLHRGISSTSIYVDQEAQSPYIGECSAMKEIREESLTSLGLPTLGEYVPTPEGLRGQPIDERTDIYLLCSIFYEMLSGEPPVTRNRDELIVQLRKHQPNFVPIKPLTMSTVGAREIRGIDTLVMKGLAADPAARFQTAAELRDDLRKVATRHEVKLFVREKAAQTMKVKTSSDDGERLPGRRRRMPTATEHVPPTTAGGLFGHVSDRQIVVGGSLTALVLLCLIVYGLFGGTDVVDERPVTHTLPTTTAAVGDGAAASNLAALAEQIRQSPTTADSFKERVETFRAWVVSPGGANNKICRYTDLMKLRYRYLAMGDTKAFEQLDVWVTAAAETLRPAGP